VDEFLCIAGGNPNLKDKGKEDIVEWFEQPPPISAYTPRTSKLGKRKAESPW
jgi:hypothetical protein